MRSPEEPPNHRGDTIEGPVLLYDGVCALCNWTVRVVVQLDRRGRVRFASLQGEYAAGVLGRHPEAQAVDSLVLVERPARAGRDRDAHLRAGSSARSAASGGATGERVHVKSAAVLRIAHHLGGGWRALSLLSLLPGPLRDWAYDVLARHRYALFGRYVRRPAPPVAAASRFLE